MPEWIDTETGAAPTDQQVQQLISAERGYPESGQRRAWFRPDADVTVLISDELGLRLSRDDGTTAPAPPIVVGSPAGGDLVGAYPDPTLSAATIDALLPPGTIWAYGGDTPPAGWLRCDGAAVSRTTYARLFAVIGTTYGPGDTVSTFNVPSLAGRMLMGESGGHARGQTGGAETAEGPPHTHPGSHGHGAPHTHPGSHSHGQNGHTHGSEAHTHGLNGHTHTVDVSHDHLDDHPTGTSVLVAAVGGTTLVNGAVPVTIAAANALHYHQFDVPATAADTESLGATTDTTEVAPGPTGPAAPATTAADSTAHAASPGTTATDATAHAAVYPGTIATLPPFGVALYMIRAGA